MNKSIVIALAILLSGCSETTTESKDNAYHLPDDLSDCKIYSMSSRTSQDITVMRCPNSTTSVNYSYQSGKVNLHRTTIVVDGVTYVQEQDHVKDQYPTEERENFEPRSN